MEREGKWRSNEGEEKEKKARSASERRRKSTVAVVARILLNGNFIINIPCYRTKIVSFYRNVFRHNIFSKSVALEVSFVFSLKR